MAASSVKLSLAFVVVLLSGLAVFGGEVGPGGGEAAAARAAAAVDCSTVRCIQGGYITCENLPYLMFDGCACVCAPSNGRNCVLHLHSGTTSKCDKTE